jgi:hypothetical protein
MIVSMAFMLQLEDPSSSPYYSSIHLLINSCSYRSESTNESIYSPLATTLVHNMFPIRPPSMVYTVQMLGTLPPSTSLWLLKAESARSADTGRSTGANYSSYGRCVCIEFGRSTGTNYPSHRNNPVTRLIRSGIRVPY